MDSTQQDQPSSFVLEIEGLVHRLWDPERGQEFVVNVANRLRIPMGSFTVMFGPNACGKSTLLSVLGLLREPSNLPDLACFTMRIPGESGVLTYDMREVWASRKSVERFRRQHLGFALQSGELLSALTVRENIALPLHLNGVRTKEVQKRVDDLLQGFDLLKGSHSNKLPGSRINNISGGEYQRVALARAIVHRPALVFVDEPTANLNRVTARGALLQLRNLQYESGGLTTVVMITHDEMLAKEFADLIVYMRALGPTAGEVEKVIENTPFPPDLDETEDAGEVEKVIENTPFPPDLDETDEREKVQ